MSRIHPLRRAAAQPSSPDQLNALARARSYGGRQLHGLLACLLLRSALRLSGWAALSLVIGTLIMSADPAPPLWLAAILLPAAAAMAGWVADRCQASAEAAVARKLRSALSERLQTMPAELLRRLSPGAAAVAIQRHPEAVAGLVIGHRAATVMMAAGPLLAAAALAAVSWQAALLLLGLTPVMILFFALAGGAIRDRARAQERSFGHLAAQFADRIRALPTIVANHAAAREGEKLAERLDQHVARTMSVLRLAFVNAGLIDFFASLSIAMLALFLGLGHLGQATIPGFSNLTLWQSLFILMIAPDYFAPFRRYSEQYHAKAEGLAAAQALESLLAIEPDAPRLPAVEDALDRLSRLPSHGLIVITGPSGSGKSTLLRRLAGVDAAGGAQRFSQPARPACSWIATDSLVAGTTLAEAIMDGLPITGAAALIEAAASVGLLDDDRLPGGLCASIGPGGAHLSGGQRMRIATARAWLATGPVFADEPTAKLDPDTAQAIRRALREMARSRLVIVASHDRGLTRLADRHLPLSPAAAKGLAA